MKEYKVTFYPGGKEITVPEDENLLRVAAAAGLYIAASCGGNQTCGKCKVIIDSGEVEGGNLEKLSKAEIEKGYRLACASRIKSDLVVRIPVESQLSDKRVLKESVSKRLIIAEQLKTLAPEYIFSPLLKKYYLELAKPTLEDHIDDWARIKRAFKQEHNFPDCSITFSCLKVLPELLRRADFKVTLTLRQDGNLPEIVNIEEGDQTKKHFALAVDIGTTSVYVRLIDLSDGKILATSSDYNGQIAYGEDIINRIVYSQKGDGLKTLQEAVTKTINGLIKNVLKHVLDFDRGHVLDSDRGEAKVSKEKISYLVAAGNTTMTHLLLGVNPKYIREAPYVPVINSPLPIKAADIGLDLSRHTCLYLFPGVASYVGGDITSGVLATDITTSDDLTLYIDIGTNGEVVVGNKDWMVTTACSAGPAFEGGTIKHGMRATTGAIEQVEIGSDYEPMIITIGHKPAKGICGVGLIDLVSELLEAGVINQKGKFNQVNTPRIRTNQGTKEYVLAFADETDIGEDIVITEPDIDDLMRAKGAIYAGVSTLLSSVGLTISDISRVIIAGNLGFHLEIEKAITIGLLPEMDYSKFSFVGNGSLLGATLSACSSQMFARAKEVARSMTNIELSDNAGFMDEYMAALFLPHTEEKRFPEVFKRIF